MLKKRTLSVLLSLAMLFAFMPAMAFAEDAADEDSGQPAVTETVEDTVTDEVQAEDPAEDPGEDTYVDEEDEDYPDEDEPEMTALIYEGPTLYYEPGDDPGDVYPYVEGMRFILKYSDGSEENIVLKEFGDEEYDYFFEDEDPWFDEGSDYPVNTVWLGFDYENATAENGLPVSFQNVSTTIPLAEKVYIKPVSVEFVAADDFVAESRIGETNIHSYELYEEGNKFVITYDNGDVEEYIYAETEDDWGFFLNGDPDDALFYGDIKLDKRVPAGTNTLTGTIPVQTEYGEEILPISVDVTAELYNVYVEFKSYSYTGKNIKPKVVVKYFDGKKVRTMSSKWYTCKPAKHKAIGYYGYDVKIKKYQAKYGDYVWGEWEILPKTPTIKKATAKKGNVTVTWGKFSKSFQKSIDGFYVRISTDKKFNTWEYELEAKPGDSKIVFTDLEKGTYYFQVVSFANPDGYFYTWESKPSKIKKVTVK